MDKLTSRKLWLFTFMFVSVVFLVTYGIITPTVFESCFWGVAAGYAGGNVGEHFANRKVE